MSTAIKVMRRIKSFGEDAPLALSAGVLGACGVARLSL
jgi:hypothetical protein